MSGLLNRIFGRTTATQSNTSAKSRQALDQAERAIARGHALEDKHDLEAALSSYREAAAVAPHFPRAYLNVGNALRKMGLPQDAGAAFRAALRTAPAYAPAHFNLGMLLGAEGDVEGAERALREALRLKPDLIDAPIALSDFFEAAGRLDDAEIELKRALAIDPEHFGATVNLCLLHLRQNRFDDALNCILRAKQIDPSLRNLESHMLFSLNLRADIDAESVARAHRIIGEAISRAAGKTFAAWENPPDPGRRLRVGYVSGDFGFHPVGLFVQPVLERHDRAAVEVYCYSNNAEANPTIEKTRQSASAWRDVAGVDDDAMTDIIRADSIDILVDLSGHTNKNRLSVFARHPAPVQATWLGYLNTTGLQAMDYRISDWHTDSRGETEALHTERLFRMPHSQWCYVPWGDVPLVPQPHADRPEAILFGSFNQFPKLSSATLDLWSRVLRRVPEAQLVILDIRDAKTRQTLLDRCARIDGARIVIRGRENLADYYRAVGNVDIALDAYPYNGATTTFDTLWMGVPMVALRGERGISRGGVSILRSLSLPELVADSPEAYVEINERLAHDASWRRELRKTMRGRLAASPLMDTTRFVADLEAGYRQMWRDWCASRR